VRREVTRFQWNALAPGDRVCVHEGTGPALTPGKVELVDVQHGSNGVGIWVSGPKGSSVSWPSRTAVHLDPRDTSEACWRCDTVAV
jgi:hypothetical protein